MAARFMIVPLLVAMLTTSCGALATQSAVHPHPGASISLVPHATTVESEKVPQGAVHFTAAITNASTTPIIIAHPSITLPADYTQGEERHYRESHGKSEILLKITRPDGTDVLLRDGYFHGFDPAGVDLLTIPPNRTETFHVGWFFQNARGRWERDDEAATVFLLKGKYTITILLRNVFPKAVLYNVTTKEVSLIDVWTGEMESPKITIEVQ